MAKKKAKLEAKADKSLAVGEAEAEKLRVLRVKFKTLYDDVRQRLSVLKNTELAITGVYDILTKVLSDHAASETPPPPPPPPENEFLKEGDKEARVKKSAASENTESDEGATDYGESKGSAAED